jgi:hypothetical protein
MRLSSVVLASFVGAHYSVGVHYYGRPVEALWESLPNQSSWAGMMSTDRTMDVFQQLPSLFGQDAALYDFGAAFLIKLPIDNGEGLSSVCEASGLYFVSEEYFMEEVVEVRYRPISLRARLGRSVLVDFHDQEDV